MTLRHWLPICVAMILLAACAPPPELRDDAFLNDTSLLDDETCDAPCWRGITPGETSWNDALTIIEDASDLTNIETQSNRETGEQLANFSAGEEGRECCRLYSRDGEVITSVLTLLAPDMEIGDVIEKYGEPEYMQGEDVSADQTFITLLFPDVPLLVYVFGEGLETGTLDDDSDVIGAIYLTQDDIDDLIRNTDLYIWDGYGDLSTLLGGDVDQTAVPTAESTDETE